MNNKEIQKLLVQAAKKSEKVLFSVQIPKELHEKLKKEQAKSGIKSFNKFLTTLLEGLVKRA